MGVHISIIHICIIISVYWLFKQKLFSQHLDKMDLQLQYAGRYLLVMLWVELFVSKDLIQVETTVSKKASAWGKCSKNDNKMKIKIE